MVALKGIKKAPIRKKEKKRGVTRTKKGQAEGFPTVKKGFRQKCIEKGKILSVHSRGSKRRLGQTSGLEGAQKEAAKGLKLTPPK